MRKVIYTLICIIAVVVAVGSTLSLLTDTPNRYLKFLDFPRLQFFWVALVSIPLFILFTRHWRWYDGALVLGLLAGVGIQGYYLMNYTAIVGEDVPDLLADVPEDARLSILVLNVKMENREAQPIIDYIEREDPDVVIGMETDAYWDEQLAGTQAGYGYSHEVINDASYGMVVYSKFPLLGTQTHYLHNDEVPSVETVVDLPGAQDVRLFAVHPVPPNNFKNHPDNEGQGEKEMLKIGKLARASAEPVIVAGDFNDVAWSRVDRLTGTDDYLYDVRVGRGMYTSFDAGKFFLRWPLDHVFLTKEFGLERLERGPDVGSDHFPILAEVGLMGE